MQISEIEAEKQTEEQHEMEAESTRRKYEHVVKESGKEGKWDVTGIYAINIPFIQQGWGFLENIQKKIDNMTLKIFSREMQGGHQLFAKF